MSVISLLISILENEHLSFCSLFVRLLKTQKEMKKFSIKRIENRIYITYSSGSERLRMSTGVKVDEKYWDKNNECVRRSHPNHKGLNEVIITKYRNLIEKVNEVVVSGQKPTVENVRRHLRKESVDDAHRFFRDFESYISVKSVKMTYGSLKTNEQTMNICMSFQEEMKLKWDADSFNKEFFEKFLAYLMVKKNLKEHTIHGHVKRLKSFLRYSYPQLDLRFVQFKMTASTDETIIHLHESELSFLMNALVPLKHLQKTRDLFGFCCLTGMRHGDSQRYDPSWEDNGVLEFRMEKTRGKAFPPLNKSAKEILKRWGGYPPTLSLQKYNSHLKDLFRFLKMNRKVQVLEKVKDHKQGYKLIEVPKKLSEVISSHVARKTFISISLIKGIKLQDVMKMSGHSDYRAMKPYIAISKQHLRDVSKLWDI